MKHTSYQQFSIYSALFFIIVYLGSLALAFSNVSAGGYVQFDDQKELFLLFLVVLSTFSFFMFLFLDTFRHIGNTCLIRYITPLFLATLSTSVGGVFEVMSLMFFYFFIGGTL